MDWISENSALLSVLVPLVIIGGALFGVVQWYKRRVIYTILACIRAGGYPAITEMSVRFDHEKGPGVQFRSLFVVAEGATWVELTGKEISSLWFSREIQNGCAWFDVEAHLLANRLHNCGLSGKVRLLPVLESTSKRRFYAKEILDFNIDQWIQAPQSTQKQGRDVEMEY